MSNCAIYFPFFSQCTDEILKIFSQYAFIHCREQLCKRKYWKFWPKLLSRVASGPLICNKFVWLIVSTCFSAHKCGGWVFINKDGWGFKETLEF